MDITKHFRGLLISDFSTQKNTYLWEMLYMEFMENVYTNYPIVHITCEDTQMIQLFTSLDQSNGDL